MRAHVLLICAFLLGCLQDTVVRAEVARVRSPTGRLEALVSETNGGATTSFS